MLSVGSLFSGIGGFDLGLERAGFQIVWQCEADEFCRRVLARHWPGVPCYEDVRELTGAKVAPVDILCGGFPCQDISLAGKGAGIDGARSGLWGEYARLIGELRPRYVVVENVAALLARGLGRVVGDLAALGYDAEWDCLPASAFGAPHRRDRIWIVAYAQCEPGDVRRTAQQRGRSHQAEQAGLGCGEVPDTDGDNGQRRRGALQMGRLGIAGETAQDAQSGRDQWGTEPDVGRVAHGVPDRVDRLCALGNALVPQIAEWLGCRILEYEAEREAA